MFDHHADRGAHLAGEPAASCDHPAHPAGRSALPGSSLAGQQVSQDWVVAAAQRAVAVIAPRELAVFTTMANLWLAEGHRPPQPGPAPGGRPEKGLTAGYRINAVLFSELVFPVISGALGEILGNSAWDRVRTQRQPARQRIAGGAEDAGQPGAGAGVRLTIEQAGALHEACERHARAAGLPSMTAAKLAGAVAG
ncbi:MAG TPA: hypothetical protein VFV41_22580 [Streptosporangiaceae bacterium]|nr:hypothetical protein [Streptosporangiaceae bacterium]